LVHQSVNRAQLLAYLLRKRASGATVTELKHILKSKGFTDKTVRDYISTIESVSKNKQKVLSILKGKPF